MEKECSLEVIGSDEIFVDGVPNDTVDYKTYYSFETLEELVDFLVVHQECAIQYHDYYISHI